MRKSLARQRHLLDHAFATLARHKSLNLGLLLIYTLIVFSLASVLLFSHAIKREAAILLAESPELVLQRVVLGRHELIPAAYLADLRDVAGIERVQGRLWGYYYDPVVAANYTLMVPAQQAPAAGHVIIGAGVARSRGAAVGDVLAFRGYDGELQAFTVEAILPRDADIVTADLMLVSEEDFRRFFGIPESQFTDFLLTLSPDSQAADVGARVTARHPDTRPIRREQVLETYRALFDWREGMMLILLVGALLALFIFIVQKASGLSAEERREVGILKAVGWETRDIIMVKFWEGLLLGCSGFLLGYNLAYWHVFSASSLLLQPVLMGWSALPPDLRVIPFVDAGQLAMLFVCTAFPSALATIGPIWRAASADPDRVMR